MDNLKQYWSLYSGNQGSGYITPVEIESLTEIIKDPVCIVDITINPGDLTDFKGFFSRELLFVGILNNHTNSELIFLMGKETDLFQTKLHRTA
ncbi:MAG: hypothetical protein K9I34_05470 [Bacteroidales bacterium]|nr:hypothetical protein [Bacteroidales bacterium]